VVMVTMLSIADLRVAARPLATERGVAAHTNLTPAQKLPAINRVAWGKLQNGLQLGLRLPNKVTTFSLFSQARFEVLLRNNTSKSMLCSWMGYPTIDQYSPELFGADGKPIRFILTIAGPYMDQWKVLTAGETTVLGTVSLPQHERDTLDALPAGPLVTSGVQAPSAYLAAFSLTVRNEMGTANLKTDRLKWTVTHPESAMLGSSLPAAAPALASIAPGILSSAGQLPAEPAKYSLPTITWGSGSTLQAGITLWNRYGNPDQHTGLYVINIYVRNSSTRPVSFNCPSYDGLSVPSDNTGYTTEMLSPDIYCSPQILDSNGKPVPIAIKRGSQRSEFRLKPGEVVLVSHWMLRTMSPADRENSQGKFKQVIFVAPGRYRLNCTIDAVAKGEHGSHLTLKTGEQNLDVVSGDLQR